MEEKEKSSSGCLRANGQLCLGLCIAIILYCTSSFNCQNTLYVLLIYTFNSLIFLFKYHLQILTEPGQNKSRIAQICTDMKNSQKLFYSPASLNKNSDNNFHRDTRKIKYKITRHIFKDVLSNNIYFLGQVVNIGNFLRVLIYHNIRNWLNSYNTLRLVLFCDISTFYIFFKLKCSILYMLPSYLKLSN